MANIPFAPGECITLKSAAALALHQPVKIDSNGKAAACSAGDHAVGVNLDKTTAANEVTSVCISGTVPGVASEAIAKNAMVVPAGTAKWKNAPTQRYGEQTFAADATTTVAAGGTFQAAEGTTAAGSNNSSAFTVTAGDGTVDPKMTLSETGLTNALFNVSITGTLKNTSGSAADLQAGIGKNGTVLTDTVSKHDAVADAAEVPFALNAIVPLSSTDYIQLMLTSDTNADTVQVTEANIVITPVNQAVNVFGRALTAAAADGDEFEILIEKRQVTV
jgi:hypothetical protein